MKIYSSGNNFIIEDDGVTYSAFYKNVVINKVFGANGNVPYYTIKNVEGWDSSEIINIEDVTNNTGMYYTEDSFENFFDILVSQEPVVSPIPPHIESITIEDKENWTEAFNKVVRSLSITGTDTKTLTITFEDNTTLSTSFIDNSSEDNYVNSLGFDSTTGILTLGRTNLLSDITVSLDDRYLTSLPAHTHTKAEITDFAHTHTKAEITDFAHTHTWGDITDAPNFIETETDPVFSASVASSITQTDIDNWNAATSSNSPIPQWTATSYTTGSVVSYNNVLWRAKVDTISTDTPSAGTKWEAITDNSNGDVIHLEFDAPVGIIYTWKNYILEYVDDVSDDIRFSRNSGKTWTTWTNPHGDVARTHIFTDGTVMICMSSGKVFTTKNFVTVTESTVLDFDGSTFVPNATHFFSIMPQMNEIVKIDGVEMVAWGDYMITGATGQADYVSRVWYSTDYGATLKCALKEGVSIADGEVYDVRHIHGMGYNTHTNKFVITSGDDNLDSRLLESTYTPSTDTWEHILVGVDVSLKFGQVLFDEHYTYFLTDYTELGKIRGIKRIASDRLSSGGSFEYIYQSDNEIAPLISYYEDSNGNRILTGDGEMRGEIYYAKNDFNFKTVTHNQDVPMGMMTSVNYQGDQYIQLFSNSYLGYGNVRRKYVNLTQAFRDAGITDFNQEKVILGRNNNTEFQEVKAGSLTGTTIKLHPEGNNYNYTTPSSSTSYTISLSPLPKVNEFARVLINAPSEPVVNVPSGKVERVSLQIESAPTSAGNITVTLDGVATDIAVDPAIETTTELVAAKIRDTSFTGWTTSLGGVYDSNGGYSNVTFTATTEGDKTDATYSEGTTGTTGTLHTVVQGESDTVATKISGATFAASTNMEMIIDCPTEGTYEYYFLTR